MRKQRFYLELRDNDNRQFVAYRHGGDNRAWTLFMRLPNEIKNLETIKEYIYGIKGVIKFAESMGLKLID